jgi:hypothetical protein
MKKVSILYLLIYSLNSLSLEARAQSLEIMYHPPNRAKIKIRKNIEYNSSTKLKFDLYQTDHPNGDKPIVVLMNGFGMPSQKDADYQVQWAKLIAEAGMSSITFESHADDVEGDFEALIGFIKRKKIDYLINTDKLVVMAFSGNVSKGMPIITNPRQHDVKAAIIYYGFGKILSFKYDMPVLLVRSGLDNPRTNRFIDTIAFQAFSNNAPWTIINHSSGRHPFEFDEKNEQSVLVIKQTLDFMSRSVSKEYITARDMKADEINAGTALYTFNWAEAILLYNKICKASPRADNYMKLGHSYFGAQLYKEALAAYESCLQAGEGRLRDLAIPASVSAARLRLENETFKWLTLLLKAPGGKQYIQTSNEFDYLKNTEKYKILLQ